MPTPTRRQLHFNSLDEVMPEVERLLAGHATVGGWSLGQILDHLRFAFDRVATGPPASEPPTPEQQEVHRRFFAGDKFPDGVELPSAFSPPPGTGPAAAAEALRAAIAAFAARTAPFPAHPRLGPLTSEEWVILHRMHCAHHLGFAVPTEGV
ncbi:MAG: DUF1569 domain-containing protein [Isosphaeraceae bacterium]